MALVVVGGHSRNIGKTSVVAGLIAAMPQMHWTAFKITQYGHGVCSADGKPCDCETADHSAAITEERTGPTGTDSGRYLAAGAVKSFWVRTRQGQLIEAMPRLRALLQDAENAIVESNSILRFLQPEVFVSVLDASVPDFKPSARTYLDRADAVVLTGGSLEEAAWDRGPLQRLDPSHIFTGRPDCYCSEALTVFVEDCLRRAKEKPRS